MDAEVPGVIDSDGMHDPQLQHLKAALPSLPPLPPPPPFSDALQMTRLQALETTARM